jgi:hypothetical protein
MPPRMSHAVLTLNYPGLFEPKIGKKDLTDRLNTVGCATD